MATISEALAIAIQHHQAGRLQVAEQTYRQILQAEPNHADAWHLLGFIAHQAGKHEVAVESIGRAIRLRGNEATFHHNLGDAFRALRRLPDAVACYRRALELRPDLIESHNNLGLALQEQGRLDEAAACYRRALEVGPDDAEVHNNLGNALMDQGKLDEAIACYRRALELKPDYAQAHYNLGNALNDQEKPDEAAACYRRALELKPDFTDAHNNLGNALKDQGKLDEAVACYRRALELKPDHAGAHNNLGLALQGQGWLDEAAVCCRRALELKPDFAEAHSNLGDALSHQGKLDEAVACYRRALELKPDFTRAHNNLGNALNQQGKPDEAVACYRRALELKPDDAEVHINLGIALNDQGKPDEAVACCRRALELKPDFAVAHSNLGAAFKDQGKLDEAVACYQRALELKPDYVNAHSNLVYTQVFSPGYDAQTLCEAHRRWNQQHAAPLVKSIQPHLNDRSADRRLRVGYVSPDFRNHVVGQNLLPLLREHDHRRFEIFCYADVPRYDELTDRFRSYSDAWRNTVGLTDDKLAQCIREDRIDILVDLTLHMAHNRLLVFARKPAAVQVTFGGYPGTTGLATIDYRLTDPYLDPPDLYDHCYSEESIRLPDSFWCYDPLDSEPPVNVLPAAEKGYISFGCLNNFCKVNPPVLKLWARVLQTVDRSRLVTLAGEGVHRQHTLDLLAEEGVGRDRVTFVANQPRQQYLRHYHGIDIGLDTVPYNGHTTSLDSLWMGVPVVTLVGPTVVGRAGLCQLMNLGLPELIASSPEQYVHLAAELAQDLSRLSELRATLRGRMQKCPLMDAPRFARNIEAAFRDMWQRWCAK
jgi:predicted O-linked N-acetylglucosamine transferase (SPINDLY family)